MSVLPNDLAFYGCANMPEDDSSTVGGAVDTSVKVVFEDIAPTGNLQVVSSNSNDNAGGTNRTVTVTGRDASGSLIAEAATLNGLTPVAMVSNTSWERILKAVKSGATDGDVAVEEATAERTATAVGGAAQTASEMAYITLDASANGSDDAYNGMVLRITVGTGIGQIRSIIDYIGATKRAYVSRDWATPPDGTSNFRVSQGIVFDKAPNEIITTRRVFFGVAADVAGGSARNFYNKIFIRNNHGSLTLTGAQLAETDPSGKLTFGLAGTLNDTATTTNRITAPGGITFNSSIKNVANSQNHTSAASQGVWLNLTLAAGDAAQDTTYTLTETGQST